MTHPRPFRCGVLASRARSSSEWIDTVKKAEDLGYSTLVTPDHFGDQLAPIEALSTAAAVTETLRIGTLVFANVRPVRGAVRVRAWGSRPRANAPT